MWDLVKKYWDLLSGFIVGLILSFMAHYDNEKLRLFYSVIILLLVCMGMFRFIRQAIEKEMKKIRENRKKSIVDAVVDNNIAVKAIKLAQDPAKEGEKVGELFVTLMGGIKSIMKKLKEFFSKYKGYLCTLLLGIITAIETYGGYINQLCGGVLTVDGVPVLPFATLILTLLVGMLSNGYSKEQMEKIKALFSKSSTTELVRAEIKKKLADTKSNYTQFVKLQSTKEAELANLYSELESRKNTYFAKKEMYSMTPQLATEEDVLLASNAVRECEKEIVEKEAEVTEIKTSVANLEAMISALKNQL